MRVLIVDDEQARHDAFKRRYTGCELVHARNYAEARDAMAGERFDVMQLDHDLQDYRLVDGVMCERTGQDVAKLVASLPPAKHPGTVILHSWNPEGARAMGRILNDAGLRRVSRVPFSVVG